MDRLSQREVAERAASDESFVERLVEEKILEPLGDRTDDGFRASDVYRIRFVQSCERAGITVESVGAAVRDGRVSLAYMDSSSYRWATHTSKTFRELALETGLPLDLLMGTEEAMGSRRPDPDEPVREDLERASRFVRVSRGGGLGEQAILRITRLYADSMRRMAEAERYVWRNTLEAPMLKSGLTFAQTADALKALGAEITPLMEEAVLANYRRAQEREWTANSVESLEDALEEMGLYRRPERPPALAFLDISGYTRLTEERGDQAAADLALALSDLVQSDAQQRGGRAVKWLGDGVMLYFSDPGEAVDSVLSMSRRIPETGLPDVHAGIASGPVVIQDGDYFGRTVNMASRLAGQAAAGQTLVTEDVARGVARSGIRFRAIGQVELKGVTHPVSVHEALASS